jgi:hypothetical protein
MLLVMLLPPCCCRCCCLLLLPSQRCVRHQPSRCRSVPCHGRRLCCCHALPDWLLLAEMKRQYSMHPRLLLLQLLCFHSFQARCRQQL